MAGITGKFELPTEETEFTPVMGVTGLTSDVPVTAVFVMLCGENVTLTPGAKLTVIRELAAD
jgi:hypothetical protein